jgi:steroid delta-isomerase-like uncharacterized protein
MPPQENKLVVTRYYEEVLNQREVELLDQLAVEDYVEHDPFPGYGNGRADLKARAQILHEAFNPLRIVVEDIIAEGDKVAVRWTSNGTHSGSFLGIPPTSAQFSIAGIDIHVLKGGRLAEHWHVIDQLAQMQQLGLIPLPSGPSV